MSCNIHPVSVRRFPSFRTQPLENLTPLPMNKWISEQPSPWRKSSKRRSCYGDRVYPVKLPEVFGDSCKNKTSILWVFAENRFLPFAPVGFRRKPSPWRRSCYGDRVYDTTIRTYAPSAHRSDLDGRAGGEVSGTPNLPTSTIPTNIAWLKLSGKSPMGLGIPPLRIKIMLESNPLKSTMLVGRLGLLSPTGT